MTTFAPPPLVKLSARRFADAVARLVEEQPGWLDGRCVLEGSLYDRLRGAMDGSAPMARRSVSKSRPPLRLDVLTLVAEVDRVTAGWGIGQGATPERLRELASRQWTPDDADKLDAQAALIEKWSETAAELLGDAAVQVPLRLPCPACGQLWAYRRSGEERVRRFALLASEAGASCESCGCSWPVEKFDWLARLLRG